MDENMKKIKVNYVEAAESEEVLQSDKNSETNKMAGPDGVVYAVK